MVYTRYTVIQIIIFTKHAMQKMDGLGLEIPDIKNIITKGMKWKEEKTNKWHSQMHNIEVVFMKEEKDIIVITTYLAQRSK